MLYEIHGRQVEYCGEECGVFVHLSRSVKIYSSIQVDKFVDALNSGSKEDAIAKCSDIRDAAASQATVMLEPGICGKIRNTQQFAEEVLRALRGS
jgi:hypothetical protein